MEMLQETKAVFGDRLLCAGFGGACVALIAAGKAEAIRPRLARTIQAIALR